jgi:hypothetical protein
VRVELVKLGEEGAGGSGSVGEGVKVKEATGVRECAGKE